MVIQDFTMAKTSYLNMKVLIFAKDENMEFVQTTANLSYDRKCSPFGDLTNVPHDLKLLSLVERLRYVATPCIHKLHPLATHIW